MVAKQNLGSQAPDGSTYVTLTDGAGALGSVTLQTGDIELGAVEIKDGTTDNRVAVSAGGALSTAATLQAGTALVGKVGIDQTTVGTTNAVSIAQLGTTAVDTNSGNKSAGTQRVVIATDQPQLTNSLLVKQARSSTGAKTNVASSATSVTILASNANRLGASVYNDSTQILYLDLTGGTASNSSYSLQIAPGAWYILDAPWYTGLITGIWASANGNARVTEWT